MRPWIMLVTIKDVSVSSSVGCTIEFTFKEITWPAVTEKKGNGISARRTVVNEVQRYWISVIGKSTGGHSSGVLREANRRQREGGGFGGRHISLPVYLILDVKPVVVIKPIIVYSRFIM